MNVAGPLGAHGNRGSKKLRQLPPHIREVAKLLVWGDPDDEEMKALDYVAAAKMVGIQAQSVRKWLYRDEFRSLLARECKAFLTAISSGNIRALWDVRENSKNPQARVAAVKTLIEMDVDPSSARPENTTSPFTINLVTYSTRDRAEPTVTIDAHPLMPTVPHAYPTRAPVPLSEPLPYVPDEPVFEPEPEPIFRPRRGY
jgi:hypothetical protein